jgi:cation diffusion facilitator family transporter
MKLTINYPIPKVVELIGGYFAGSLAVMGDAAHLITDSLTFIIGIVGIAWGEKSPDRSMTFGYRRIEIVCAVASVLGIWMMTMFICYFAIDRLVHPSEFEIDTDTMLIIAVLGIIVNIV